MVGNSPPMRRVYREIDRLARPQVPILLLGETGTGKDMAARAISQIWGPDRPFVVVCCAVIAANLIESELFGHERGAFSGAWRRHEGFVAQADRGILFLDEIAELPLQSQATLLRVIETGEYRRVGGERTLRSDFRLLAATNRDLDALVAEGRFRRDLLHRLGAARIALPPLRERLADLPLLSASFLRAHRHGEGAGKPLVPSKDAMSLLRRSEWPGNVRQLRNVIEAVAAVVSDGEIEPRHVSAFLSRASRDSSASENEPLPSLADVVARAEAQAIGEALRRSGGNRVLAASWLGISPATLYRKLADLDGRLAEEGLSNLRNGSQI